MVGRDLPHAPQELIAQVGELVGPHRRGALDGQDAAVERLGLRAGGDLPAGGAGPRAVGPRLVARLQPRERRVQHLADATRLGQGATFLSSIDASSSGPVIAALTPLPICVSDPSSGSSMTVASASSSSVK